MTDPAIMAALINRDFSFFVRFAFYAVGGEGEYQHNWHIDAMSCELDRVHRGENRRLIITMPPRSLKSLVTTVARPAWELGHNPALRYITVSYGSDLAEKQGRDMLKIMDHPLSRRAFPRLRLTRRSATDIETSLGGGRLSTSLGGILTGRGADRIIIDDPTKSVDASSKAVRDSDRAWLLNTLPTRLNDPANGAITVVMQRLHQDDLVGILQEQGGWHELNLSAIAAEDELIQIAPDRFYQRRAGHALHPERLSIATLMQQKRAMGSYNFSAQYLQNPLPETGNLVKAHYLRSYDPASFERSSGLLIQSWDTASKENPFSDYSVCVTAVLRDRKVFIVDVFRARLVFPKLKAHAIALAREHACTTLLIEDQSSGTQLIQTLRSERPPGVPSPIRCKPEGDKVARVGSVSAMIEDGRLFLPREADWLDDFRAELLGFPNAKFDDQVDALSQLMIWVQKHDRHSDDVMVYGPRYGHKLIQGQY